MEGFLALGFLIGMHHALEADHIAAVGTMMAEKGTTKRGLVLRGAVWGLGHTITLFAIGVTVILLGFSLTEERAAALEFGVGIMLVLLGADVLYRMRKKRVHFHLHDHGEGRPHLHAHSHEQGSKIPHDQDAHQHTHKPFPLRALVIGLIHGAAGSAGLLALAVAATQDAMVALSYIALFGLGSVLGMAALSFVAASPLHAIERRAKWIHNGLSLGAAALAIGLGINVMAETGAVAMELL